MANQIIYSKIFIRKAKELKKRHPSLVTDLEELEKNLLENPKQGGDLGAGLHKVRLAVKSKGKGKSGGYRVITFLIQQSDADITINMLTIYDKADESSIDKKFLITLAKELFNS
jgi:mRNA-degrading endonuclease RelE of RelBE toxin-antitoxin system